MNILKAYKFVLKLTKKQSKSLQKILDECRWLYNLFLEQRISAHELEIKLTKYDQLMMIPALKIERPSLDLVHSQVLQDVGIRLDKSFQNFFRRCKNGETPGFPRFKGYDRYNSFCFPQSGFELDGKELKIAKVGRVRIKQHRSIDGKIKTCTIIKEGAKWFACFCCEVNTKELESTEKSVGIDVGLENFAVLSTGEEIKNPRFFQKEQKNLAKAQRKLSELEIGSSERKKQKKVVQKIHRRVRNKRSNFCHQTSRQIINQFQYICIEDLNIKKMMQGSYLAKSISDASWNQFCQFLTYKAAEAGRKLGVVNPAYTSQTCSQCGNCIEKKLSERTHLCMECGYKASRDLNAAQNILALGLDGLGLIPRSLRL